MAVLVGLTSQLSDRRTDVSKPETPRRNPTAEPGSLQRLVRHPKVHHSKISGPSLSAKTERRPAMSLRRECNREPRQTHEKKSNHNRGLSEQNGEPLIYAHRR